MLRWSAGLFILGTLCFSLEAKTSRHCKTPNCKPAQRLRECDAAFKISTQSNSAPSTCFEFKLDFPYPFNSVDFDGPIYKDSNCLIPVERSSLKSGPFYAQGYIFGENAFDVTALSSDAKGPCAIRDGFFDVYINKGEFLMSYNGEPLSQDGHVLTVNMNECHALDIGFLDERGKYLVIPAGGAPVTLFAYKGVTFYSDAQCGKPLPLLPSASTSIEAGRTTTKVYFKGTVKGNAYISGGFRQGNGYQPRLLGSSQAYLLVK